MGARAINTPGASSQAMQVSRVHLLQLHRAINTGHAATCYLLQLSVQMMHQGSNQNFGLHRMESRAREIPDNFPRGCAGVHIHVI